MDARLLGLRNGTRFSFPDSVFPEVRFVLAVDRRGPSVSMETVGGALVSVSASMLAMYEGRLQVVR